MIDAHGMKRRLAARFVVGASVLVTAALVVTAWLYRGNAAVMPSAPPWEYRVVQLRRDDGHENMQTLLNIYGNDGWEFAGMATADGFVGSYVVLKRPGGSR